MKVFFFCEERIGFALNVYAGRLLQCPMTSDVYNFFFLSGKASFPYMQVFLEVDRFRRKIFVVAVDDLSKKELLPM